MGRLWPWAAAAIIITAGWATPQTPADPASAWQHVDARAGIAYRTPPSWTASGADNRVMLSSADGSVTIEVVREDDADAATASARLVADACYGLTACSAPGPTRTGRLHGLVTVFALGAAHAGEVAVRWRADLIEAKLPVLIVMYGRPAAMANNRAGIQAFRTGFGLVSATGGSDRATPPQSLYAPNPAYTIAARRARVEGSIVADIEISADGQVTSVTLRNHLGYGLDEAAVAAIRTWRFQPATRQGQPVATTATVQVNFHLGP